MPPLSDKELEERLTAAGNSLLQPPSSLDELLPLLDQIEELLSKVEQSPAKSMQAALSPLMKALVAEELVKHPNVDVKVGVASCISEITRITAPDAPYDDDKMKDVFQLIVSSFENLADTSSRSHEKRATILETVAKVRSCVIMLDLECDQMIIEMFQNFLKSIRVYHAEVIFASMETIMTLVLEESEDISPDLLNPILATLKRNNEAVTPIAKKLAERVIQNSADKLRPYLAQALTSLDASLDDYSEVIASVCRENAGTLGHSIESILEDQPVIERKTSASPARDQVAKDGREENNSQDKVPTAIRSPKSVVSNGINDTGNVEAITDTNSMKKADSNHQVDAKSISKVESDDCNAEKPVNSETKLEQGEAQQVPQNDEISSKDVHISSEVESVQAAKSSDNVEDTSVQLSPSKAPENEAVDVASPAQSGSLLDEHQSRKDSLAKRKENLVREETESVDNASKKISEEEYISEAKKQRRSGKKRDDETSGKKRDDETSGKKRDDETLGRKRDDETSDKDKAVAEEGESKNNDDGTSDSEGRSLEQTEKQGDASVKMEDGSSFKKEDGRKVGRAKPLSGKEVLKSSSREDNGKDTVTSPSSPLKSTKDEGIREETPKTSTKRKRTPGTEKASETIEYGENLVGSKVKVWWPKDRMFYEGVIASFDPVKKKHKVLYTDGDKEVLNLRRERWEFIGDDLVSDGDQDGEHSSHDASSDMQRKKKGNTNSETSSKRRKMDGSPKTYIFFCLILRPGAKNQTDSAKASGRSKDDVAKTPSHSKQDGQRSAKSKGKTPQSGKTPGASGTRMTKSSSSKVKETDRMKEKRAESAKSSEMVKGKSTDTAKSRESESKSGKKRRR
ncbi:UNVERIFIED_CONTAM: Sister chromatid cohesion protein PDS5 [Sesamum latifolium]|uniref:Sister chromatid cohesion protein PDS5 n=1 Tax=Sesamum latifolium TaxID=2727402 RepID=A0AAW2SPC9_9LAMI